jgi:hypothetical protein
MKKVAGHSLAHLIGIAPHRTVGGSLYLPMGPWPTNSEYADYYVEC